MASRTLTVGVMALAALASFACGGGAPAPAGTPAGLKGDFLSSGTTDPQAWVALSTDGRKVVAYGCDGVPGRAPSFSEWFEGTVAGGIVDLRSTDGARLVTSLTSRSTTGRMLLTNGASFDFTLTAIDPRGQSGLFRSEQTVNGVQYLAGWVLSGRPDASTPGIVGQRGGVQNEQSGALAAPPPLDQNALSSRQVAVPSVGTFTLSYCVQAKCL